MTALGGTIDIPKVGPVPKAAVIGVTVAAAGYVGWRYWKARGTSTPAAVDPGLQDPGTIPAVAGAVPADGSFGGTTGGTGGDGTGQITTNAAWSNDALAKLTATGSYDAGAVAGALGAYLGSQPLTTEQQAIVRAAIAVSGYPPVGTFSVIPGGNTGLTIAPGKPSVTAITTSSAQVSFGEVNGATSYQVFRNGTAGGSSAHSPIVLTGLAANTTYSVYVVAATASGKTSPPSSSTSFKTAVTTVGKPGGLKVTSVGSTSVNLDWSPVAGAIGYQILVNGVQNGSTITYSTGTARSLKSNTKYTIGVRAVNASNSPGPAATVSAKTKK